MSKLTLISRTYKTASALYFNNRYLEVTTDQQELSKLQKQNKQLNKRLDSYRDKLNNESTPEELSIINSRINDILN